MYYARVAIPVDLQPLYPTKNPGSYKRELWKSLGTRDPREASAKALPVLARWEAEFEQLRTRRNPTPDDLQKAVWHHYESELEHDRRERAALPNREDVEGASGALTKAIEAGRLPWSDDPIAQLNAATEVIALKSAADDARNRRAIHMTELRKQLASGETALIEWAADDVVRREGLVIPKGSSVYRDLCQRLQRAQIETLQRTLERDKGDFTGEPADPIVVPPDPTQGKKHAAPGETILELYARFAAEKKGVVTKDTWEQNRIIVGLFAEFIGETSHISAVTRKAVRDWKQNLMRWPVKATTISAFRGMSFRKIIEANETLKRPTLSENTINRYLSAVAGFADWLLDNEYIEQDAMRGMFLGIDKKKRKVFPFTDDQLKAIFGSPLFGQCRGDEKEHLPGNVEIRDWRYWIPNIALYTGARLGEISQLLTADVRQIHGVWVFHITREGSERKSTKTEGSQRVVPVHSALIKMGLIEYHSRMAQRGEVQLFPEVKPDIRGHWSGYTSKFFADYLSDIGVKKDRKLNFHSFRHTMADAFRRAGYLDEQFNLLLGHTKATTTGTYGIMPEGTLKQRVEMIEAVEFRSLN